MSLSQLKVLEDYAEFLISRGLKVDAVKTYQKILDEFIVYPLQLREIRTRLKSVL